MPVKINGAIKAVSEIGFSKKVLAASVQKTLRRTRSRIFGIAAAALIIGIIASFILAYYMAVPIKEMAKGAALIGQGKLDTNINVKTRDELGALAKDLNLMADQLKELDQMKKDFVSSVTHELRSPITSIGMNLDLFIEGSMGYLNEEQKNTLQIMKDSASRLERFINDLLDVAKLERGKMEITPIPVNISSVITAPVRLAKVLADSKKISISTDIPENLPNVFIDIDRIQQVITNLLSNAIKFTPQNGSIRIRADKSGDSFLLVSVKDSGIGIPKGQIYRIFDKFEQVKDPAVKVKGSKGTGLGLSIVKSLIELHGGKIWVESETGKGTSFNFTLPKVN
jgi:signal transduction histidine kinase